MKKHWWKILLGCLVLFSIVGVLWEPEAENAVELVVSPQTGPFRSTITTTGELQAKNSVRVNGPSRAQQMRIYEIKILSMVPEGTIVEKGDLVAELDPSELTNRIKDAEADLEVQQSEFTQAQLDTTLELSKARDALVDLQYAMEEAQIKKEQAIYESPSMKRQAQIEYEKAERSYERALVNYDMEVQQAAAKVRATRAELSKTQRQLDDLMSVSAEFTVLAPEKGMVIYRDSRGRRINDGSTINTWNPVVATLPDLSVMESKTFINEVDIQRVKTGQQVEVGLDAIPDKRLTGTVTQMFGAKHHMDLSELPDVHPVILTEQ
jgi:multidrug efflux pump subunit AcrA (membrane-fusion protein)